MERAFLLSYAAFVVQLISLVVVLTARAIGVRAMSNLRGVVVAAIAQTVLAGVSLSSPFSFIIRHPESLAQAHPFVLALLVGAPSVAIAFWLMVWLARSKVAH